LTPFPFVNRILEQYREWLTPRGRYLFWMTATLALIGLHTKGNQVFKIFAVSAGILAIASLFAILRPPVVELGCRLPSRATVGQVGNLDHENANIGKAGRNRWLGWRPTVRGVVMNPVDHPHGGGEGRTSGGRHPVTPWGVPTKGKKTRNNRRTGKYIVRRRKTGK